MSCFHFSCHPLSPSFWLFLFQLFFLFLVFASIFYYVFSLYFSYLFFQKFIYIDEDFLPPVSIIKPLCGLEENLEANLISFIQQEYPQYQLIFCVQEATDAVINLLEELRAKFPDKDLRLVVSDRTIGHNYKVSNMDNGLAFCDYDFILIADSDIEVKPDYLKTIVQPFKDEKVGVVTCLYQPVAANWLGIIESLNVIGDFIPKVLTAVQTRDVNFAFGSTILIRREVLEAIGCFKAIANNLADDFLLGFLPHKLGYRVELVNYFVRHHQGKENFRDYIDRQIRWQKCILSQGLLSYLGMIFTQGAVTSIIFVLISNWHIFSVCLMIFTILLRITLAYLVGIIYLKARELSGYMGLVIVGDFLNFYTWVLALFKKEIVWRGRRFRVKKHGYLEPIYGTKT
ncbi:MAG: bacteriohopanetetrol glucosamine biosynthesis glycosyltransferase HpnI [Geminocystis sp.]|nr:bacteriohopanetetrol glucosamine biosynthesis glycosyltransferase HpnI [Geminocystis sp.]MDW8116562.1 bacteriohopanetetrol glucosamine biosynthesis glycosyltransferase HpnI [Geminocystis sp.]